MQMIQIRALPNGAHNNQTAIQPVPEGYAIIPNSMEIPSTYPFVYIEVEEGVVIAMTPNDEAWAKAQLEIEPYPTLDLTVLLVSALVD